jgi:hypothetical protein
LNWESGGCEIGAFEKRKEKRKEKEKQISAGNHFEEEDFYSDEL